MKRWIRLLLVAGLLLRVMPGLAPAQNGSTHVDLSFDQVDIRSFVKLVGDITGRRLVVDDGVTGKITIVAPNVARDDVMVLFSSILASAGCATVDDGQITRVVSLPTRRGPSAPVVGPDDVTPAAGLITKIIRVSNVSASELRRGLMPKGSSSGGSTLIALEETNHLIITDTAENVRRLEKIVAEVDRPGLSRTAEVIALEFAGAEDMARQLSQAVSERETRGSALKSRLPVVEGHSDSARMPPAIVASPHANALIVVGTAAQILSVRSLVTQMDVDRPVGRGRLNAIFLKYISAEEAAKNISALLQKSAALATAPGRQRHQIAIEADVSGNALLVDAGPGEFDVVRGLIEQLDRVPRQVHIEVMIVEVSARSGLEFGVEMAALDMPDVGESVAVGASTFSGGADSALNLIQQGIFPRGLSLGVASGVGVDAQGNVILGYPGLVNVVAEKRDTNVKLLSRTALEVENNKEASINIVDDIPILTSTIQGGAGTSRDVIQNIERIDVGIKLTLTPHIIPDGQVRMQLNPSIEAIIEETSGDTPLTPTIARRDVTTTVTVPDGETIIIAGLTKENEISSIKRVPLLGYIPLLGLLFRSQIEATEKTDLLIMVTPRIVGGMDGSKAILDEWKGRTGLGPEDIP